MKSKRSVIVLITLGGLVALIFTIIFVTKGKSSSSERHPLSLPEDMDRHTVEGEDLTGTGVHVYYESHDYIRFLVPDSPDDGGSDTWDYISVHVRDMGSLASALKEFVRLSALASQENLATGFRTEIGHLVKSGGSVYVDGITLWFVTPGWLEFGSGSYPPKIGTQTARVMQELIDKLPELRDRLIKKAALKQAEDERARKVLSQ